MNWYSIALFAHIVGVLALFITQALQWLTTLRLRRAQTLAQARERLGFASGINRLMPMTLVLIIGAGVYMAAIGQLFTAPWLDVSFVAIVIMMALGAIHHSGRVQTTTIPSASPMIARRGAIASPTFRLVVVRACVSAISSR